MTFGLFITTLVFGLLAYALGYADGVKREREAQHHQRRNSAEEQGHA